MNDVLLTFLRDLGDLIRAEALKSKDEYRSARGSEDEAFRSGRLMAYYEVVSLMRSQAEAFGVPVEALRLDGLDPERDLLV